MLPNWRDQEGQSLIIFAFGILGLIAFMGLALDLGLVYIERVRVSRTTDSAALASVVELPFEEEAIRRAVEYIALNGYPLDETQILVRGCVSVDGNMANVGNRTVIYDPETKGIVYADNDPVEVKAISPISGHTYPPSLTPLTEPKARFVINTLGYQAVDYKDGQVETLNKEACQGDAADNGSLFGTATKLSVYGEVDVGMNFMQFFGFPSVLVSDQAVGENVTNLDVVVVFDVSGSMNYETTCFGCWREKPEFTDADGILPGEVQDNRFPSNGEHQPLPMPGDLCTASWAPLVDGDGYHYSIHEAEYYSRDVPIHGWEFEQRNPGQGFWVLQRMDIGSNNAHIRTHPYVTYSQNKTTNFPQLQGGAYNHECFNNTGGLTGECWKNRAEAIGEQAPSDPPFVEYDFQVDWTNPSHVWIRAIAGPDNVSFEWWGRGAGELNRFDKAIYYQIDGQPVAGGPEDNLLGHKDWSIQDDDKWRWVKIGQDLNISQGKHTLRLYQGSSGFNVDKVIITDNPALTEGTVRQDFLIGGPTGPVATLGSATREACNVCNPAFGNTVLPKECSCMKDSADTTVDIYPGGGTGQGCTRLLGDEPVNLLENDLFHDVDPLRSAQEAVRNFAQRLDPKFDQIGFVAFSSQVQNRVKLMCRQYAGKWLADGVRGCYDPNTGPIIYNDVLAGIENNIPQGSTNIAQGMREGLQELGVDSSHECPADQNSGLGSCDRRGGARRILILMTDGSPNTNQGAGCPSSAVWRGQFAGGGANDAYDCSLYYASQAADSNVVVYTIGIGSGVNRELLTAMATGTDPNPAEGDDGYYFEAKDGQYFPATKPSDLDAIFESILSNIYVRIVG